MNQEAAKIEKYAFGFWVYLMTDLMMFAALFAVYAVLHGNTAGGPGASALFSLPNALTETLILLTSSFTCGLALLAARSGKKNLTIAGFAVTFSLGISFLSLELREFSHLIAGGNAPQASGFLSAFFTLVGTHGLHIAAGLLWMFVAMVQVRVKGISPFTLSKLERLALFWHFLDLVWIFIFTTVYLFGVGV